jgi:hypothetical protein
MRLPCLESTKERISRSLEIEYKLPWNNSQGAFTTVALESFKQVSWRSVITMLDPALFNTKAVCQSRSKIFIEMFG